MSPCNSFTNCFLHVRNSDLTRCCFDLYITVNSIEILKIVFHIFCLFLILSYTDSGLIFEEPVHCTIYTALPPSAKESVTRGIGVRFFFLAALRLDKLSFVYPHYVVREAEQNVDHISNVEVLRFSDS